MKARRQLPRATVACWHRIAQLDPVAGLVTAPQLHPASNTHHCSKQLRSTCRTRAGMFKSQPRSTRACHSLPQVQTRCLRHGTCCQMMRLVFAESPAVHACREFPVLHNMQACRSRGNRCISSMSVDRAGLVRPGLPVLAIVRVKFAHRTESCSRNAVSTAGGHPAQPREPGRAGAQPTWRPCGGTTACTPSTTSCATRRTPSTGAPPSGSGHTRIATRLLPS